MPYYSIENSKKIYKYRLYENDTKNLTFTIRFKSDIDQLDKENFYSINSSDENDENNKYDTKSIISLSSYELVWKTFLINQIITRANMGEYSIFVENENYNTLVVLLKCLYGDNSETGVIMPKIKKGAVEITASFIKSLSTSLKLELEFDERKKRINYQRLSKKIYDLFTLPV